MSRSFLPHAAYQNENLAKESQEPVGRDDYALVKAGSSPNSFKTFPSYSRIHYVNTIMHSTGEEKVMAYGRIRGHDRNK
jgi:hypothetical protein